MLQATLRGKLTREEERMEDLLTSNTFGLMKYLPCQDLLVPFLSLAWNPISKSSLEISLKDVISAEHWHFWEPLASRGCTPCEPDVAITLRHQDASETMLLIEAKYLSSKSSTASDDDVPPNDQLAREFDNLTVIAKKKRVKRFALIYLTANFSCPTSEIKESIKEFQDKRGSEPNIYWLSWRMLPNVLESEHLRGNEIAQDMATLFQRFDLTMFRRLRFQEILSTQWTFLQTPSVWDWSAQGIDWQFNKTLSWVWSITTRLENFGFFKFHRNFPWNVPRKADLFFRWR